MTIDSAVSHKADEAFNQARRRAFFGRVLGFFTGHQPDSLLSFDYVRDKLKIRGQHYVGIETIALDKIVGSTGRYQEFNRAFLPTQEFIRDRWKRVYEAAHARGFPPIEVYKIGEAYFVRDGHHRVSVLKELGATTVEAAVTELDTPIPFSPDTDEQDLDLKEEYASFLLETGLDSLHPEQRIEFTLAGQYRKLLEHIAVHRHFVGVGEQREIPHPEAVARWYEEVYMPVVGVIREEEILDDFPGRTEADLYLWIIEHRHYLGQHYGADVSLHQAAAEFSKAFGQGRGRQKASKKPRTVAVFGSGSAPPDHPVLAQAEQLGRLLAEAGYTLLCGGYGGTMEAASRGAHQAGGQAMGVTMDLLTPPLQPNPWLTKERRVSDFFPRLKHLTSADAFVVLQGGIGTLTEATLAWTLLQTGQISPRPFIFVGKAWPRLFAAFRAETFMMEGDFALATVVNSVEEAVSTLRDALAPSP